MGLIGTKQAAKILGVTVSRLHQAVWLEKFPSPAKMNGGYVWTEEDLRRAYRVLHGAPMPPIPTGGLGVLTERSQVLA